MGPSSHEWSVQADPKFFQKTMRKTRGSWRDSKPNQKFGDY